MLKALNELADAVGNMFPAIDPVKPPSPAGALDHVRSLFPGLNSDTLHRTARLLDAVEAARDVLSPVAEEVTPAGIAAGIAFQILSDAAADAAPPSAVPPAAPESRNGYGLLLADALARGRVENLDGTSRRECRPLKP